MRTPALEKTPQCEVTGLPLPILPLETRVFGSFYIRNKPNWHHHFHPENDPILRTLAGYALRKSRVQFTPFQAHTEYHRLYGGSDILNDTNEIFRLTVLSAAGVVPRRAIDPRELGKTVGITDKLHQQITRSIKVEQPKEVAMFLADYCAQQEIDTSLVELLLDEKATKDDKRYIARELLSNGIESALGNFDNQQTIMKREKLIMQHRSPTLYSVTRQLIRRHAMNHFASQVTAIYKQG